jgi:hypothetical protein
LQHIYICTSEKYKPRNSLKIPISRAYKSIEHLYGGNRNLSFSF